jgi:hypothetical protein
VVALLMTACERAADKAASPAEAGRPPGVAIDVPVVTKPIIPEGLSEPPRQAGEPNDRDANAARKKKPQKLVYAPPTEWARIPPCTGVLERFVIKHVDGDQEDAILDIDRPTRTVGGAGAVVDRWRAAFSGPDGGALPDGAFRSEALDVSGLSVTLAEIRGHHKAPGPAPARPGVRLFGAVVDTPAGLWAFKLLGPERTVESQRTAFLEFIRAVRME